MFALASIASACGDDDDGGRPRYQTGIQASPSTGVSDLGDRDLDRICESLDAYVETNIDFGTIAYISCLPQALVLSGGNRADCERRLDACTELFPEPVVIRAQIRDREVCYSDLRSCRASVAELEGCVNVNLDLALDILDWSCSGAGDADLREQAARVDTVTACADLDAACSRFATIGPD
jgi:hypothetical protein